MIHELVKRNRSYRRFDQSVSISESTLRELVDLARFSATAMNLQPYKFILSHTPERNAQIFAHLHWAIYLTDWDGPKEGERPSAYIVIVGDTQISETFGCDYGIAAQSMLLGAVEHGLGGCMIASIDYTKLLETLQLPDRYETMLVVALGKPAEDVQVDDVEPNDEIKYWRDKQGVLHVPKRRLDELILNI